MVAKSLPSPLARIGLKLIDTSWRWQYLVRVESNLWLRTWNSSAGNSTLTSCERIISRFLGHLLFAKLGFEEEQAQGADGGKKKMTKKTRNDAFT